jgi:predicted murein hydrolase (TIGR00659 family)
MTAMGDIWVYLSARPLTWLAATIAVFVLAQALFLRTRQFPPLNPVLTSIVAIGGLLLLTGTPYQAYFDGAQFIHFLLGPATVALALPLRDNLPAIRRGLLPFALALAVGSLVAMGSAVGIGLLLGVSRISLLALVPKSVTAPVAMAIVEQLGGLPSLAAPLVALTGIAGAVIGPPLLRRLGVTDDGAVGAALGVAAHGIGTARAFQHSAVSGSFAAVALAVNALFTATLVSAVVTWLGR